MESNISRRNFLALTSLTAMGITLSKASVIANILNPNSKFGGVQIGAITYSFRSMPHDVDQLIQFCVDCNISAIELMGDPAEEFAGKPKAPFRMGPPIGATPPPRGGGGQPGGPPRGGGQRPPGGGPPFSDGQRPARPQPDGQPTSPSPASDQRPTVGTPPAGGMQGQRPQMTDEQRKQMAEYNIQVAEWRKTAPMDKFKEVGKKFKKAGISIYAFKPNAFGANNTDAEVEYGMQAAKAMGATSVTVELPTDPKQSQRLGDLAAKHKIFVGYHEHLQATDTLWDEALAQSPYNSMNLDCGHYIAAGGANTKASLLALIEAKHDRITSLHIKDRTNKERGQGNLAWGSGDTPLKEILLLMKEKKYKFPASVELEYEIPAGSNALIEVAKCVAYCKALLA